MCVFAAACITAVTLFSGCTKVNEEVEEVTEVVTEEEVQPYPVQVGSLIFNSSPESVASLSPAVTEIIAELGFTDKLIGRSIYCDYPESVSSAAELGSAANPDVDAIISAAPTLLISHSPIAKKDITSIENAGTRVLIIPAPTSVSELYDLYISIYHIFNGADGSEEDIISDKFELLEECFDDNENLLGSFVYVMSDDLAVASSSTFAGDFLSHMGTNAAADSTGVLTSDDLSVIDPDYVIIGSDVRESKLPDELASHKVIRLDEETEQLLERPTSRLYIAVEKIAEIVRSDEE
jgi:iron complex transport system substrate-binding protein